MDAFDIVLGNMKRMGMVAPDFQGTPMTPQKRVTSRTMPVLEAVPVRVLVGLDLPVVRTKAGTPAKRQPAPLRPGDRAYAKLRPDGIVSIVPFAMAGAGYELVRDAEEGVHYEFAD